MVKAWYHRPSAQAAANHEVGTTASEITLMRKRGGNESRSWKRVRNGSSNTCTPVQSKRTSRRKSTHVHLLSHLVLLGSTKKSRLARSHASPSRFQSCECPSDPSEQRRADRFTHGRKRSTFLRQANRDTWEDPVWCHPVPCAAPALCRKLVRAYMGKVALEIRNYKGEARRRRYRTFQQHGITVYAVQRRAAAVEIRSCSYLPFPRMTPSTTVDLSPHPSRAIDTLLEFQSISNTSFFPACKGKGRRQSK